MKAKYLVFLVIGIITLVSGYSYSKKPQTSPSVALQIATNPVSNLRESTDWNKPFKKNDEIEDFVRNTPSLPDNHTACISTKKFHCTFVGCEVVAAKTFNLIGGNSSSPAFSRCDRLGCDTYDAIIEQSGEYKNLQIIEPKGVIFKMSYNTIDKKYVEIATLGLDTYMTYGYCMYDLEYKR